MGRPSARSGRRVPVRAAVAQVDFAPRSPTDQGPAVLNNRSGPRGEPSAGAYTVLWWLRLDLAASKGLKAVDDRGIGRYGLLGVEDSRLS